MKNVMLFLVMIIPISLIAQNLNVVEQPVARTSERNEINIANIPGYLTLKCDLHTHTVFSDGMVWPNIRVHEAWFEGLDVLAITDHIEYRPKKKYLNGDHNTSYKIAKKDADHLNILLVKAGEITRKMAPGHLNALFLDDVNALDVDDPMAAIEAAIEQGAFIQWNHPGWRSQQPDTCKWWPIHEELYQKGWLHGIEVFNHKEYYPVAFDWCVEKNLAFTGNSDVHGLVSLEFDLEKYNRPMTLVFAKERSLESLKEAMFAKRTCAYFANQLAGPEDLLKQIFDASVIVGESYSVGENKVRVLLSNPTDLPFVLYNDNPPNGAPKEINLNAGKSISIQCKLEDGSAILPYNVTNLHTGLEKVLKVDIEI